MIYTKVFDKEYKKSPDRVRGNWTKKGRKIQKIRTFEFHWENFQLDSFLMVSIEKTLPKKTQEYLIVANKLENGYK